MKILLHTGCSAYRDSLSEVSSNIILKISDLVPYCQLRGHEVMISGNNLLPYSLLECSAPLRHLHFKATEDESQLFLENKGYMDYIKRLKQSFDFDMIILWGDYFENRDIKQYATQMGISCMFVELACLRNPFPEALFLDPQGANGDSSLKHHMADLFKQENFIKMQHLHMLDLFEQTHNKKGEILTQYLTGGKADIYGIEQTKGKEYILCPLQLSDDANITYNSSFDGMADYVSQIAAIADTSKYCFIITPHPSYQHRLVSSIYRDYMEAKKIVEDHPNMIWCDEHSTFSLTHKSKAVLSINSSAAFEAMIMNKIVYTTGQSCFLPNHEVCELTSDMFDNLDDDKWCQDKLYQQHMYVRAVFALLIHNKQDKFNKIAVDMMELLSKYPNPDNNFQEFWEQRFNNLFTTWVKS